MADIWGMLVQRLVCLSRFLGLEVLYGMCGLGSTAGGRPFTRVMRNQRCRRSWPVVGGEPSSAASIDENEASVAIVLLL